METITRIGIIDKETEKAVLFSLPAKDKDCDVYYSAWLPKSLIKITNKRVFNVTSNFGMCTKKTTEAAVTFPKSLAANFKIETI